MKEDTHLFQVPTITALWSAQRTSTAAITEETLASTATSFLPTIAVKPELLTSTTISCVLMSPRPSRTRTS